MVAVLQAALPGHQPRLVKVHRVPVNPLAQVTALAALGLAFAEDSGQGRCLAVQQLADGELHGCLLRDRTRLMLQSLANVAG